MYDNFDRQINRQVYLDFAKGLGIILVVWAHAHGPFSFYINSFHMPFFFFISGMLYKGNRTVAEYTKNKMRSLLLPFFVYNLLMYPIFFVLYYWGQWNASIFVKEITEIITTVNKVPFLGATWFLASLFWVSVIIHIIYRFMLKRKINDLWLILIGIVSIIIGLYITFPYRISRTLICAGFYSFGYIYNKYISKRVINLVKAILAIVMFLTSVYLCKQFPGIISSNEYDNKWTFIIGALSASLAFIWLSRQIATFANNVLVKHVCYLGRESIHIVIWQFLAFRFAIIVQIAFLRIKISALTAFPVYDASGLWFVLYLYAGIYGAIGIGKCMDMIVLDRIKKRLE